MTTVTRDPAAPAPTAAVAGPSATFEVSLDSNNQVVITLDPTVLPVDVSLTGEDIHIYWSVASPPAVLTFKADTGLALSGIKLGWLEADLDLGTGLELPFTGLYEAASGTFFLTETDNQQYRAYSLTIEVSGGSNTVVLDPKIYNEGPPPSPSPGGSEPAS